MQRRASKTFYLVWLRTFCQEEGDHAVCLLESRNGKVLRISSIFSIFKARREKDVRRRRERRLLYVKQSVVGRLVSQEKLRFRTGSKENKITTEETTDVRIRVPGRILNAPSMRHSSWVSSIRHQTCLHPRPLG